MLSSLSMPSPSELLDRSLLSDRSELYLLTGPSGAGKTTFCLALREQALATKLDIAGLISPPVFEAEEKIGIDVLDVPSGTKKRLASLRSQTVDGPTTEKWMFYNKTLEWGNDLLERIKSCQVFILDELGPLEFERGLGFMQSFKVIDARRYQLACVVVRPELLPQAHQHWPWAAVIDLREERQ